MRISLNTVKMLAGLGDTEAKFLAKNNDMGWTYTSDRGRLMATVHVNRGQGRTMIVPIVPPPYTV